MWLSQAAMSTHASCLILWLVLLQNAPALYVQLIPHHSAHMHSLLLRDSGGVVGVVPQSPLFTKDLRKLMWTWGLSGPSKPSKPFPPNLSS